jgi:hypothetical protein
MYLSTNGRIRIQVAALSSTCFQLGDISVIEHTRLWILSLAPKVNTYIHSTLEKLNIKR